MMGGHRKETYSISQNILSHYRGELIQNFVFGDYMFSYKPPLKTYQKEKHNIS